MRRSYVVITVILFLIFQIYLLHSYQSKRKTNDECPSIPTQASNMAENENQNETKAITEKSTKEVALNITNEFEKLMKIKNYACFHKCNLESQAFLLEDIYKSKRQPTPDKTIFFVITNCFKDNLINIGKR